MVEPQGGLGIFHRPHSVICIVLLRPQCVLQCMQNVKCPTQTLLQELMFIILCNTTSKFLRISPLLKSVRLILKFLMQKTNNKKKLYLSVCCKSIHWLSGCLPPLENISLSFCETNWKVIQYKMLHRELFITHISSRGVSLISACSQPHLYMLLLCSDMKMQQTALMIVMGTYLLSVHLSRCKYWHYDDRLLTSSVVIVFHNEGWSTLMRTIHSVIKRTPRKYLAEIVMIDDFSNKGEFLHCVQFRARFWKCAFIQH